MKIFEYGSEDQIPMAFCLMKGMPRSLIVTVVDEVPEIRIERIWPVWICHLRIEHTDTQPVAVLLVAEAA